MPEIDPEVDFDSRRAVYFRQMRYGLFVRHLLTHAIVRTDVRLGPNGVACKCYGISIGGAK